MTKLDNSQGSLTSENYDDEDVLFTPTPAIHLYGSTFDAINNMS